VEEQRAATVLRRTVARRPRQAHTAVRRLAAALLAEDRELVWSLAVDHLRTTGSRLAVFGDLLHPAQRRLSELWYSSVVGHADEARAARSVLAVVRRLPPTPAPSPVPRGSRCLLAALPGERHTLGLEMLRAALEDEGWTVRTALGMDIDGILHRVRAERPRFVGLTAGCLEGGWRLAALADELRRLRVPLLVGGQAFSRSPDLWRQVGATAYAADLRVGMVLARRTIGRSRSRSRRPSTADGRVLVLPTRNGRPGRGPNHTAGVWQ